MRALSPTATAITAPPRARPMQGEGATAALIADQPQYRYAGDGRFLPANEAARQECAAWNAWAAQVNARTARGASRHDHRTPGPIDLDDASSATGSRLDALHLSQLSRFSRARVPDL